MFCNLSGYTVVGDALYKEYLYKKNAHDALSDSPFPSFEVYSTRVSVDKSVENRIKLGDGKSTLCENVHVPPPISVSSVEDSNRDWTHDPPRNKASEDKASRKRFRKSFVLKGKKNDMGQAGCSSVEKLASTTEEVPTDCRRVEERNPVLIESQIPFVVDITSPVPSSLERTSRMILSIHRKTPRIQPRKRPLLTHAQQSIPTNPSAIPVIASPPSEQATKVRKLDTDPSFGPEKKEKAKPKTKAKAKPACRPRQSTSTIGSKRVVKAAPKPKQRSTTPSNRNERRRLIAADERRKEKRNEAQRRYRLRRALKAKQEKEEAEKKIRALLGGEKSERRRLTQYNLESLRFILKVGTMPN